MTPTTLEQSSSFFPWHLDNSKFQISDQTRKTIVLIMQENNKYANFGNTYQSILIQVL